MCATKDEKRLKSTVILATEGNGRNRDSQRNGNEETKGARYGAEIVD